MEEDETTIWGRIHRLYIATHISEVDDKAQVNIKKIWREGKIKKGSNRTKTKNFLSEYSRKWTEEQILGQTEWHKGHKRKRKTKSLRVNTPTPHLTLMPADIVFQDWPWQLVCEFLYWEQDLISHFQAGQCRLGGTTGVDQEPKG